MEPDELRVGTAEREEAARLLAEHLGLGRITPDEYEARVLGAYQATTRGELRMLFRDLPPPHPMTFAPVAVQPPMALPDTYSYRSKTVAGVLQIVLPFGAGRFYTGQIGLGLLQLFVCLITAGLGAIWPLIDGILLLANGGLDAEGRPLRP